MVRSVRLAALGDGMKTETDADSLIQNGRTEEGITTSDLPLQELQAQDGATIIKMQATEELNSFLTTIFPIHITADATLILLIQSMKKVGNNLTITILSECPTLIPTIHKITTRLA